MAVLGRAALCRAVSRHAARAGLPPPLPRLARPCQPPHLARPCKLGLADDFSPGTKGADPIGRLRIIARLAACQTVHISCEGTNGIAPTWSAVQFCWPVGGRAGVD
eukprot:scaffold34559_cov60-Phaeocystis_antarctica.AAC.1